MRLLATHSTLLLFAIAIGVTTAPAVMAQTPPHAVVHLTNVPPGALLWVDQRQVRSRPARPLRLQPGRHRLQVEARGRRPWIQIVDLEPGEEVVLPVELGEPRPARSTFWLVSGIVATVLGVGAEALALVLTNKANDEYRGSDGYNRYRNGAIASHVTAGVLGLAAGVSFYLYFSGASSSVAYRPDPGGGVLTASFHF